MRPPRLERYLSVLVGEREHAALEPICDRLQVLDDGARLLEGLIRKFSFLLGHCG